MSWILSALLVLSVGGPAAAEPAPGREVVVETVDEDGAPRARRIWFAVVEGRTYVRSTPLATWGVNARRQGALTLRDDERRTSYRVRLVEDEDERARVHAAFRAKYGRDDVWADVMRFLVGGKITFRLEPAAEGPAARGPEARHASGAWATPALACREPAC